VDHDPVGAAIDPALVGIARDVEAAGADIAPAVGGMPFRRRKPGEIDRLAGQDVFEDRAVRDIFGGDARHRSEVIGAETLAQLDLGEPGREPQRHVLALAAEEVDQHPAAFDGSGYLPEQ
jgi:hypothetical protein